MSEPTAVFEWPAGQARGPMTLAYWAWKPWLDEVQSPVKPCMCLLHPGAEMCPADRPWPWERNIKICKWIMHEFWCSNSLIFSPFSGAQFCMVSVGRVEFPLWRGQSGGRFVGTWWGTEQQIRNIHPSALTILILEKFTSVSSVMFGVPSSMKDRSLRYIPRYGMHGGSHLKMERNQRMRHLC